MEYIIAVYSNIDVRLEFYHSIPYPRPELTPRTPSSAPNQQAVFSIPGILHLGPRSYRVSRCFMIIGEFVIPNFPPLSTTVSSAVNSRCWYSVAAAASSQSPSRCPNVPIVSVHRFASHQHTSLSVASTLTLRALRLPASPTPSGSPQLSNDVSNEPLTSHCFIRTSRKPRLKDPTIVALCSANHTTLPLMGAIHIAAETAFWPIHEDDQHQPRITRPLELLVVRPR